MVSSRTSWSDYSSRQEAPRTEQNKISFKLFNVRLIDYFLIIIYTKTEICPRLIPLYRYFHQRLLFYSFSIMSHSRSLEAMS